LFTRGVTDYSCGGRLSSNGGSISRNAVLEKLQEMAKNTSETATFEYLSIYGFAFYKGALVLVGDLGNGSALSFGIIVIDNDYSANEKGIITLKHERGHVSHMMRIGAIGYFFKAAIPSAIGAHLSNKGMLSVDYESLPWERIADFYGGVDRGDYESWADYQAFLYWLLS